jgi:hypothetical protein
MAFLQDNAIDPRLLQQQSQGMSAINQMKGLNSSPAMVQALRQSQTPLQEMRGQGNSARAVNPLEALSTIVQRRQGQSKMGEMEKQAEALRGKAETGQMAQLQAAEQSRLLNQQFQTKQAEDARIAANARTRGGFKTWQDAQGNQTNIINTPDGPKTAKEGQLESVGMEGLTEIPDPDSPSGRLRATESGKALAAIGIMKSTKNIRKIAEGFTPKDEAHLNAVGRAMAQQAITPKEFENFVQSNMVGASERVQAYLTAVKAATADERKRLSGTAVSRQESTLNDAFLPGGAGISLKQRMQRLGQLHDRSWYTLSAIDEMNKGKLDYVKNYGPWEPWEPASVQGPVTQNVPGQVPGQEPAINNTIPQLSDFSDEEIKDFETVLRLTTKAHKNDPRPAIAKEKENKRLQRIRDGFNFDTSSFEGMTD